MIITILGPILPVKNLSQNNVRGWGRGTVRSGPQSPYRRCVATYSEEGGGDACKMGKLCFEQENQPGIR